MNRYILYTFSILACSFSIGIIMRTAPTMIQPSGMYQPEGEPKTNQDTKSKAEVIRDQTYRDLHLSTSGRPSEDYSEKRLTPAQRKLLDPAPEDLILYAEFLRQPDSGLIRLLPRGKYESAAPGSANSNKPGVENTLPILGGGAFYSFTKRSHVLGQRSDILLKDGLLRSGFAGEVLGLMVMLGNVPVETVTLNSPGIDYLAGFIPPTSLTDANDQHKRNLKGFTVASLQYKSALPAIQGMTYALRSMAYGRADNLIVFRVIRQDEDGSLIIVWKQIKKFQVRKLKE